MARVRLVVGALLSALALTQIGACASGTETRSTGRFVDDAAITARVKTAIARAPDVSAMNVNVTTYRGVVQLSGFVNSEEAREQAVLAARQVEGVRSIDNNLAVQPAR